MMKNRRMKMLPAMGVLLLVIQASAAWGAINLISSVTIPLKEDDRVMGSLKGNFLIYDRSNVALYNQQGDKIFSKVIKNNTKPVMASNGNYLGLVTYDTRFPTALKTEKLEMYEPQGKFRWKLDNPAANSFVIADDGAIFGIEGVEGMSSARIHMFDPYGILVTIVPITNYHSLLVAPSGKKFIIDKARDGLEVYDSLGNLIGTAPVSRTYVFDKDDRYFATFFNGEFHLFQDQKEIRTIKSSEIVIIDMVINVQANLAVLMASKRLEVFELTTGKLLWEFRLTEERKWFTSLDLDDAARFIACGLDINQGTLVTKEKRHVEGYLYLFTSNGKTMAQRREDYALWGVGLPRGALSPSAGVVTLLTREKLQQFFIR